MILQIFVRGRATDKPCLMIQTDAFSFSIQYLTYFLDDEFKVDTDFYNDYIHKNTIESRCYYIVVEKAKSPTMSDSRIILTQKFNILNDAGEIIEQYSL